MSYKLLGAVIILSCCGGYGFFLASGHRRNIRHLNQLLQITRFIKNELAYRLTPLPELFNSVGQLGHGSVYRVFRRLSDAMTEQIAPDVSGCMRKILQDEVHSIPISRRFIQLGTILGRFDLQGQIQDLTCLEQEFQRDLEQLHSTQDDLIRNYRTLGLCAGTALIILLI